MATLFQVAAEVWRSERRDLVEAPTADWLRSYLLDAHSGTYQVGVRTWIERWTG